MRLAGAGPGDADLLAVRAVRSRAQAEIVFHDGLAGEGVLALASPTGRLVTVAKPSVAPAKPPPLVNRMLVLVEAARGRGRAARLKGFEPSEVGRAAEEIAPPAEAGLEVRSRPGVANACAAAAEARWSLTLRGAPRRVSSVTAQTVDGRREEPDRAAPSAGGSQRLHVGRAAVCDIAQSLLAAGLARDGPALAATDVGHPSARRLHTPLGGLTVAMLAIAPDARTRLMIGGAFAPPDRVATGPSAPELAAR